MVGHDDDGIDFERTRLANGSKGIAQNIDSFIRSQNGTAAIRYHGEEKVPPETMAHRYCMGSVGLRCANPTYSAKRDFQTMLLVGTMYEN